ncbi:MAG TPA: hypothetical protein VFW19_06725 [Allosphingosinicella sp.]|nr:hypothetical protein [Allosphingosinicella sp.]
MRPLAFLACGLSLISASPPAQPELHSDLIHSDLPLWTSDYKKMWPRAFVGQNDFGCIHNIRLGDWKFDQPGQDGSWYRLTNYGVFHCFLMVRSAFERSELETAKVSYSFLIDLGRARRRNEDVELWALQMGGRPSDYLLLARKPERGAIRSFEVLQRECPREDVRSGRNLAILLTSYCAINDQQELIALARRMAQRAPLGTLTFVASVGD